MLFFFLRASIISNLVIFFFHDPPTTDIYTLSLHDALPISIMVLPRDGLRDAEGNPVRYERAYYIGEQDFYVADRKSTRLNSSHLGISYAVFCLKKKKNTNID